MGQQWYVVDKGRGGEENDNEAEEEEGEGDFILSIWADGEWDYTIKEAAEEEKEKGEKGGALSSPRCRPRDGPRYLDPPHPLQGATRAFARNYTHRCCCCPSTT